MREVTSTLVRKNATQCRRLSAVPDWLTCGAIASDQGHALDASPNPPVIPGPVVKA
jgi:hypothetical protein